MEIVRSVDHGRCLIGKLAHGSDLLGALTDICVHRDIRLGRVEALGAVKTARVGFYNQETREYEFLSLDRPLEILKVVGNVSMREGSVMIHAHITLGDGDGNAYGGHLAPGTVVFACEYVIQELVGDTLERGFDQKTGLPLWRA